MKALALIAALVFFSSPSFAQTVAYELTGVWIFQINIPRESKWSVTVPSPYKTCIGSVVGGGSILYNEVRYGTITFEDDNQVTLEYTDDGVFNLADSNDTVKISWYDAGCGPGNPTVDNGHAVFDPPPHKSQVGSYSINPDGTGAITLGGVVFYFQSAGVSSDCVVGTQETIVPATMLLRSNAALPNESRAQGSAARRFSPLDVPCAVSPP